MELRTRRHGFERESMGKGKDGPNLNVDRERLFWRWNRLEDLDHRQPDRRTGRSIAGLLARPTCLCLGPAQASLGMGEGQGGVRGVSRPVETLTNLGRLTSEHVGVHAVHG